MGKKKIGKYIVDMQTVLGQGSFAIVYLGLDSETKQNVAVKVIDKVTIKQDDYTKNAFEQEIRIMMKLKSQNIIGFLDVNQTKSNFYLILEIANEGTLRTILMKKKEKNQTLAENIAIGYLMQLLNGFGELLKIGIIHRDIKPDNICVKDGVLKIGDFGFAKNNSKLDNMMSTIVGSPAYMAPQIMNKQKYSYKCDIWSLGVMTYEMLTGQLPFDLKSHNLREIYKTIQSTKIKFPQNISQSMIDFISGCLRFKEEERFDWPKVFLHPIFKGSFQKNFEGMKRGQETLAYIMGSFRMIINQYNVDIESEIKKFKKSTLSLEQFQSFLLYLNCDITKAEVDTLCELLNRGDKISLNNFQELLYGYECRHQKNNKQHASDPQKMKFCLAKNLLRKRMALKPFHFKEFVPESSLERKHLNLKEFQTTIHAVVHQLPVHIIPEFYTGVFCVGQKQQISLHDFYAVMHKICKQDSENEFNYGGDHLTGNMQETTIHH